MAAKIVRFDQKTLAEALFLPLKLVQIFPSKNRIWYSQKNYIKKNFNRSNKKCTFAVGITIIKRIDKITYYGKDNKSKRH